MTVVTQYLGLNPKDIMVVYECIVPVRQGRELLEKPSSRKSSLEVDGRGKKVDLDLNNSQLIPSCFKTSSDFINRWERWRPNLSATHDQMFSMGESLRECADQSNSLAPL
ncbi:hypothetical protein TNCV_4139021 [Trichonephila clavipes]|nr:hypothetical protein TNCV_4139021 [Trichonephila clavipes]